MMYHCRTGSRSERTFNSGVTDNGDKGEVSVLNYRITKHILMMIILNMTLLGAHFAGRVYAATDKVHFPSFVIKALRLKVRPK